MVNMVSGSAVTENITDRLPKTSSRGFRSVREANGCGFTTSTTRFSESNPDSVVSYEQLKNMLSSHNVQLFDVRNQDEFMAGRITDSVNIPLGQLEESLKLSPEHFQLLFETGRRSAIALAIARQLGFNRARHYQGGYSDWAHT
ncbi:hypothetical protein J4Q44_G00386390 [Coregonus suidteri]|uniref:Rhodanese domain-containing protein n=1 Tax=Coregonus suidteri TaxID=861788 RepID=A0AAN8Q967_9TELE